MARGWSYFRFLHSYFLFKTYARQVQRDISVKWCDRSPYLQDRTPETGFDRHYIYHTAWAARVLAGTKPAKHVDISSSLYFSGIVSAFVPIEFYDYRPAALHLDQLKSGPADLLALPFADDSIESLSCMHVIEHIGLGRYGDQLDPNGDLRAINELKRVLTPGGKLLIVVPVGQPKVVFNAHRIYSYEQVVSYFSGLDLMEFWLIPDTAEQGGLIRNASPELVAQQSWGCGCFLFTK
ncbi:MAG: DUF268 domain-containing protein [Sulfuricaulis sp.]